MRPRPLRPQEGWSLGPQTLLKTACRTCSTQCDNHMCPVLSLGPHLPAAPPPPSFQFPFPPCGIRCWGRGSTSRADKPEIDPGDTILRLDSPGGAAQGPRHGPLQAYVSWASGLGYRVGSRSAPHPPLPYRALRTCPGGSSIFPAPLNFSPRRLPCPSPQLLLRPRGTQMPRKAAPGAPGSQPPPRPPRRQSTREIPRDGLVHPWRVMPKPSPQTGSLDVSSSCAECYPRKVLDLGSGPISGTRRFPGAGRITPSFHRHPEHPLPVLLGK